MAVRLNKALKELNVGINTVAEFLQKKGAALQDATPNAKITDEQYALLKKEFGEDMKQNAETKQKIQNQKEKEQQEKKERQQALKEEKERIEKEKAARKPQLKILGNINDMKKSEPKAEPKPEPKPEPKAEPKAESPKVETVLVAETPEVKPVETQEKVAPAKMDEQPSAQPEQKKKANKLSPAERLEQDENGVYHLAAPAEAGVQFKQVGFIDLSSLNSKTRPDRKSKAERRKERQQAQGDVQGQNAKGQQGNAQKKKRNRINNSKVDIDAAAKQNNTPNAQGKKQGGKPTGAQPPQQQKNKPVQQQASGKKNKKKQPVKPQELSEEEVAKQVKETLARLTAKQEKKGVKYRKDKRNAIHERMAEVVEAENAASKVLKITEFVTANELATMMDVPVTKVIGTCMSIGMMVSIN